VSTAGGGHGTIGPPPGASTVGSPLGASTVGPPPGPSALSHVFSPGRIGPLRLPHRLIMGSMHLGLEATDQDGSKLAAFYRERAAGGAALIVTGGVAVSKGGAAGRSYALIDDPSDQRRLARVAQAVHHAGALIVLQLFHAGRYASPAAFDLQPVAPSAVYSRISRCEPHALSDAEIDDTIEQFATGARLARALGFDGIEIMGSEGYLLNEFMAPATNQREDDWGGSPERRRRLPLAVAEAVRSAAGPELAVIYRLSGTDLVPDGTPLADVLALAQALADGPADALSVGIGWHESRVPTVQGLVPLAAWAPWTRAIREAVRKVAGKAAGESVGAGAGEVARKGAVAAVPVPVIASNRVPSVEVAESVLAAGAADFVAMARPFLADPALIVKTLEREPVAPVDSAVSGVSAVSAESAGSAGSAGSAADQSGRSRPYDALTVPPAEAESFQPVNLCIACSRCVEHSIMDEPVSCVVNPRAGHELDHMPPHGNGVRVAVVGGGPAGMEAARALATVGYRVSLLEAGSRLGGQFRLACRIPGKAQFASTIEYFEAELERLRVTVRLGVPAQDVRQLDAFDAVVVAVGVRPRRPRLPGVELPHVLSYRKLLAARDPAAMVGRRVAIIGAGGIGVDVAHLLSRAGGDRALTGGHRTLTGEDRALTGAPAGAPTQASANEPAPAHSPRNDFYARYGLHPDATLGPFTAAGFGDRELTLMRRHGRIGAGIGPVSRWAVVQELQLAGVQMLTDISYREITRDGVVIEDESDGRRLVPADNVVIAAGQEPAGGALATALAAAHVPHIVIGGAAEAGELDAERAFREGFEAPKSLAAVLASAR